VVVLYQINALHILMLYFFNVFFNIILPPFCWFPKWSSPFSFFDRNCVLIYHLYHACYISHPSHPPWFDCPNIFGDFPSEYNLWCSFLQPPVTSTRLGPNILLSILFLNTTNLCSSLMWESKLLVMFTFLYSRWELNCMLDLAFCQTITILSYVQLLCPVK
jgi:hypothetical protein